MADTSAPSQSEILLAVRRVQNDLALRLAHNHGLIDSTDSWEGAGVALRKDYLDLARETLAVMGGPSEAQQEAARLAAEVRELRRQRDRYRDAWQSACRRVQRARRAAK